MVGPGILGRYIAGRIGRSVLFATLLLVLLLFGVDLVRGATGLGGAYGFGDLVRYLLGVLPVRLYDLYPFAVLIGTLAGLGRLAAANELVAMRASGFDRKSITCWVLGTGLVFGLAVMYVAETIAPRLDLQARLQRAQQRGEVAGLVSGKGLWLRDGAWRMHAALMVFKDEGRYEFLDLVAYHHDDQGRPIELIQADSATFERDRWRLIQPVRLDLRDARVERTTGLEIASALSERILGALATRPRLLPMTDLLRIARQLEAQGQDASRYREAFWRRLYYPVNLLAMTLAGVLLLLGHQRMRSTGAAVFIGVMIGIAFVVIHRLSLGLSAILPLSPAFIQLLAPAAFVVLSLFLASGSRRAAAGTDQPGAAEAIVPGAPVAAPQRTQESQTEHRG
ncbi:MAG: LPS export ABC transporter permease LptG [Wenzhouxiangellaceae bacterium]